MKKKAATPFWQELQRVTSIADIRPFTVFLNVEKKSSTVCSAGVGCRKNAGHGVHKLKNTNETKMCPKTTINNYYQNFSGYPTALPRKTFTSG